MKKTFIIAEAGVNHNGDIGTAKKMVDTAAEAGADAIKFQTFTAEKIVSRFAPKAAYQMKTTDSGESQFDMIKKMELNRGEHEELLRYCKEKKILFLSSPFDLDSIDLLNELGLDIFKIPSGEIINYPFLKKIGSLGKKIILSTGMADMGEIEDALDILMEGGTNRENITVLHCTTEYPAPFEDVNLFAMCTIGDAFRIAVGYSDHTQGIEIPVAAVVLGASVIEKHFTLDRDMEGPDHKASVEPQELEAMIGAIRHVEKALGNGIKKPSVSELRNKPVIRKSIVAARDIEAGEIFTEKNITVRRPGNGISPMEWSNIIGKRACRDFKDGALIEV